MPHVANTFAQEISVRHVAKTFTQAHITNQIKSKHITLFFLSVPSVANTPPQDHIWGDHVIQQDNYAFHKMA